MVAGDGKDLRGEERRGDGGGSLVLFFLFLFFSGASLFQWKLRWEHYSARKCVVGPGWALLYLMVGS